MHIVFVYFNRYMNEKKTSFFKLCERKKMSRDGIKRI